MKPKQKKAASAPAGVLPGEPLNFNSRFKWADILVVLFVAWVARAIFLYFLPVGARSFDSFAWETQAGVMKKGLNPYHETDFFSWAPFWMQVVYVISKIADFLNVPFFRVLQVCLILFESAVMIQVVRLIQIIAPEARVRTLVILGLALNPVSLLLICQHSNFDIVMALWVVLAAASLLRYNASNDILDWLCACFFLGLGILTKTVPLVFVPLLAGGFRRATPLGRFLGMVLALGPVAFGISIIYVLTPADVLRHVLGYQARSFYFGFPGLLKWIGGVKFVSLLYLAFDALGIGVMALTCRHLWEKHSLGNRETILYFALVFIAVPVMGPGFGGQYFYWFLPFLVISYACYAGAWRKLLIALALISSITFIIEYGLNPAYGYNFLYLAAHANTSQDLYYAAQTQNNSLLVSMVHGVQWMDSETHQTMERLPLFISLLSIIAFGTRILLLNVEGLRKKWVLGLSGFYAFCVAVAFAAALGTKFFGSGSAPTGTPATSQPNQNESQN